MSIHVTFACGHQQEWIDKSDAPKPECQTCGERRIARTNAPKPVFRGACVSPLKKE